VTPYYADDLVTLYHGDCRDVLPTINADVMVTDPPYGIDHSCNWEGPLTGVRIANDSSVSCRDQVLADWGKPALVFGSWKKSRPTLPIRAVLVWDKGSWGMGDLSLPWTPSWEEIYVIGDGFSGRRDNGVLRYNAPQTLNGREHPNEKPVELMRALVHKCDGGVIVDPFAGSGATLRACKDLGRKAIGIEIEERYCELAAKRMSQGSLAEMFQ
jgi:DNA modification methylase